LAAVLIEALDYSETFARDYKKAPLEIRKKVGPALELLKQYPQPAKLRTHSITGCFSPRILKIDVTSNKSWQITFSMDGTTAILRRLATHKEIDRTP